MKRIDELGISPAPWKVEDKGVFVIDSVNDANGKVITGVIDTPNASLIAAAPDLLAFAAAYYDRHKKNAIKQNPSNGDKYQDGIMMMCKQALVKAGLMDEREMWEENPS